VDALGTPVNSNPTVQYTFTSVKTLIDQHYTPQLSASNAVAIVPGLDNAGIPLTFGAAQGTDASAVKIAADGTVTFNQLGSYIIQQVYYAQATSGTNIVLNFKTLQGGATQIGPTSTTSFLSNSSTARHRIDISSYVDIDINGTYYNFWIQNPTTGGVGSLQPQTIQGAWGTDVPSAQLIITKLA
jgi:hypothetical protein